MLAACRGPNDSKPFDITSAKYLGMQACTECHREIIQKFLGSHHDQAMQVASEQTVLGDFSGVEIEHHGLVSRMYRNGEKYMCLTEGPSGQMEDFEVKYVFGLTPLQQYMVEFPVAGQEAGSTVGKVDLPRIQVLRLCWNTEAKKWFYLPPPDVPEKLDSHDDLHWTGVAQRWNNMCAECHSTNYEKNFSVPSDPAAAWPDAPLTAGQGQYHSSFSEINVSCEACHGPASVHVELARQWSPGWNRERGYGLADLKVSAENQIQACAPCHSRRDIVMAGFVPGNDYYDHYTNQLLVEPVYYSDGQILDEDYVHGSFIQSKMYHKGIRCTDCHDPHSARLKQDGNAVCTSCHQHPSAKYDTPAHHFHKDGSPGAACVNCHMPATTYMEVDARRDHSLRIPRPDLSIQLDTPNACTGCHLEPQNIAAEKRGKLQLYQDWMLAGRNGDEQVMAEIDRANRWCDEACDRWYGTSRRKDPHFGEALHAGQHNDPQAVEKLRKLLGQRGEQAPAIARATALQVLSQVDPAEAGAAAVQAVDDESPLVRAAVAVSLPFHTSRTQAVSLLEGLLSDSSRSVRTSAARSLLEFSPDQWSSSSGTALRKALDEVEQGLKYNNDRAGAHMAQGLLAEQQGRQQEAIRQYQAAIAVEPGVAGPRTNLAALLERNMPAPVSAASRSTDTEAEQVVRRLRKEELQLLARDVQLLPEAAAIQYRYGLALYVEGNSEAAVEHLIKAAQLAPDDATYAQAVCLLFESLQRWSEAMDWAEEGLRRSGGASEYQLLKARIEQGHKQSTGN